MVSGGKGKGLKNVPDTFDSPRYNTVGGNGLTYDAAGNVTTDKNGYEYEYDYENRIVKIVKDSNDIAEYAYDALGRRIKKYDVVAGKTRLYYYNTNNQMICDFDSQGVDASYKFIYGNYIDEVLMVDFVSKYLYVHDHLYSPVAVANLFGSFIMERYEYDAYGNCTVLDGDPNNFEVDDDGISDFADPYYFTGRRLDVLDGGDLKVMYYRNRYYDTETGWVLSKVAAVRW